ncbi:MAG TPA: PIN domain-containing protein [Nitrososphaera sp.]|jgi:hypothetical protein
MMNQFAKLQSSQHQTPIMLDTCMIASAYENRPEALELRKKLAHRKDVRIMVPGTQVREVAEVVGVGGEQVLELVESFSKMGQIDYIIEDDDRIASEADKLKAKYPRFCHSPDDIYLAYCKELGVLLVTYYNNLRKVARMEGIMTCTPGNFRPYQ